LLDTRFDVVPPAGLAARGEGWGVGVRHTLFPR
jgi:hypothetical protein